MGRMYRVVANVTLATSGGNADLVSIQPADDKPCKLAGWILGQTSEIQDAAEESLRLTMLHMTATVTIGAGGSSPTPAPNRPGTDLAAGFTARVNDATVSTTSGTTTTLEELAWNIRGSPWERFIPEELRPRCLQGEVLIVRMESTPTDDIAANMTFFVEEEG